MLSTHRFPVVIGFSFLLIFIGCSGGSSGGSNPSNGLVLTLLTPSSAIIGSSALTLDVSGSDFTSGSEIEWDGSPLPTTYISATLLSTQITAAVLAVGGTAQVTVFTPGGNGGTSNALAFNVGYPTPSLTSISPQSATAGSQAITLTATGSGFVSASQIAWNGTALTTTYVSATQLTAQVPASDLLATGTAAITVVSPSPGGGQSNSQKLSIISGATRVAVVAAAANDLIWDATHARIYASLPGANGTAGSVVAIDPITGNLGTPQPAGMGPNILALSSDASHLWVGVDGSGAVQRFTLPDLTSDINFSLPKGSLNATQAALALKTAPNNPDTVAVLLGQPNSPSNGVMIYDDAMPRPMSTGRSTQALATLEWGADALTLYGSQGDYGTFGLSIMAISSSGASLQTTYPLVFAVPLAEEQRIHFDQSTGYIYGDNGRVVNPATGDIVGTFNLGNLFTQAGLSTLCVVDSAQGIVFFLGQTFSQYQASSGFTIQAFDKATYRLLSSLNLPQLPGHPVDFIRWGNAGLAFNTSPPPASSLTGSVYLVDGSFVNGALPADTANGAGVAPFPGLTAISPQQAPAGSAQMTLTLSGANFQPGAVAYWNGQALNTVYNNPDQLQATIPAANLAAVTTANISVSNGSSATSSLNQLAFTVTSAASTLTAINLATFDVAWDKNSSLLYAGVWSADPQYPNSIIAIDPTTGRVTKSQYVGSDPYLVRTTVDGAYLYTGFMVRNSITQMQLPSLGSPLSWSLGANSVDGPLVAVDLQPAPGASQTTAISSGNVIAVNNSIHSLDPTAFGSLTIFDNNVARPVVSPVTSPSVRGYGSIQWSPDDSTLYVADNEDTDYTLYKLSVNSSGVTVSQMAPGAVANPILNANPDLAAYNADADIHYDSGTGYLYDDNGLVIDPATASQVSILNSFGLAAPDSSLNRVFILGQI